MIRKLRRLVRDDAGMTTAEYAVGTIVPVGPCSWQYAPIAHSHAARGAARPGPALGAMPFS